MNEIKAEIHYVAGLIGAAFITFCTVPAVQHSGLNAFAGHPKIVGFLVSAAAIGLAYKQSRNLTVAKILVIAAFLSLTLSFRAAAQAPAQCGTERWSIKTLADPDAARILAHPPAPTNIVSLRGLPAPESWSETLPRQKEESRMVRLRVKMLGYKLEDDQDYHIVIAFPQSLDVTMIAEIPAPACFPAYADKAAEARAVLNNIHAPASVGTMVTFDQPVDAYIVGVPFFDKLHGQIGVAPNGIEIHPVLSISTQ